MKKKLRNEFRRGILFGICFAVFLIFVVSPGQAEQTTVSLSTPDLVKGNTVYATVNIENVENLDAGQFDISFNPKVLKIASIENGSIGETAFPLQWNAVDEKNIRVIFNLEGVTGVSGSGQLAKIGFKVVGDGEGELNISGGLLGNTEAKSIDVNWQSSTAEGQEKKEADTQQKATPGFEAVLSLVGLITGIHLAWNKKRR